MPSHDFLFALWDGGGNVPPQLSVARALLDRGHAVRVLADPILEPDVRAAGADFVGWAAAPHRKPGDLLLLAPDHDTRNPMTAFGRVIDNLMCGPAAAFAADTRAELARRPADVVVAADALLGVRIAAEADRVPAASLFANPIALRGWGAPPFGPGFRPARGPLGRLRDEVFQRVGERFWDRGLEPVNAARRANGLPPVSSVIEQLMRVERMLVLTSPAFEYPTFAPPANVRLTGARLDDPVWAGGWTPPPGDAALVLVSLSTTAQGQEGLLRRCVAALGRLPVRGLVTTGPSLDPATIGAPSNVTVVAAAPHSEVLAEARAVVTHAGHGTLVKALAAGVPVVALPMGRDQLDVAARLAHHGAGVRLRPGTRPARIARAVRDVVADPRYAEAAARIATAIAAEGRRDLAAEELEGLAAATR